MKKAIIFFITILSFNCKSYDFPEVKNRDHLLEKKNHLLYENIIPEPEFKNITMPTKVKREEVLTWFTGIENFTYCHNEALEKVCAEKEDLTG